MKYWLASLLITKKGIRSPVHLKEERGDMMNDLEYGTSSECEVFSVPKSTSVVEINSESWQYLYSRASINKK